MNPINPIFQIDISFITINYNSSRHTNALIKSIIEQTSSQTHYEIIIVDNASEADDYQFLQQEMSYFPQVSIIRNRINNGFAGGNMLGVNHAKGKYYFFINNDCTFLNDCSTIMKGFMDTHDEIATITAKIRDKYGHISSSYGLFPSISRQWFGNSVYRKISSKKFPSNKIIPTVPTSVEIISGSCMFFRAKDFCNIGGFDTIFFLYCEEEDICKRVWSSGKMVYIVPDAEIFHEMGGSSVRNLALEKEFYISYNLLINKHFDFYTRFFIKAALWFKQFRRIFTKNNGLKLFLFVLSGSPIKESLRYKQQVL